MHECYNPYSGRIIRIVGNSGLAYIESNLPSREQFPFTFDKIVGYKGEYPPELKQFGAKGLKEGVAVSFTLGLDRKVACVHFSSEFLVREAFVLLRQNLRQLLADNGVASNPAVEDDWIVNQLRQLLGSRR